MKNTKYIKELSISPPVLWENTFMVFFNCSAPISVLKRNTLFNQREPSLFQQFHGKKTSHWLPLVFHFSTENWEEHLAEGKYVEGLSGPTILWKCNLREKPFAFCNQWYFPSVALTVALIQTRACSTAPNKGIADLWKWSCWEKFEDALRWREVWLPELDHVLQTPFSM